jgi:aldehyde:ferredoxin oxidoreductase
VLDAVACIAERRGTLGELLSDGSLAAARKIGRGAERFAMQAKGQEFPMHDPRYKRAMAIGYAVSPTGADHCHPPHDDGFVQRSEEGWIANASMRMMGLLEPVPLDSLGPDKVRSVVYGTLDR